MQQLRNRAPRIAGGRRGPRSGARRSELRRSWKRAGCWLALAALYSGCSLAGDITPPPAVATAQAAVPAPTSPAPAEAALPASIADPVAGERIYAERCAACHGPAGAGNGEMAAQLDFPPTPLGDPELAQQAVPQSWFQVVTNGRLDRLMPPFLSLSDAQRWNVVAYALSLSVTTEQARAGRELFAEYCAACHERADFEIGYLQSVSRSELSKVIREGRGAEMPAFGSTLDADQLWALAGYVQSQVWTSRAVTQPQAEIPDAAQPEAEPPAAVASSVVGQVLQGTPGSALPAALQVRILGFDGEAQVLEEQLEVDSQGGFRLEPVETAPGRLFFATVEYQGVQYRSEIAHAPVDGSPLELSLTVFETSSDPAPLRVERLHLLIDFPDAERMRVLQLWVVENLSDRVVMPGLQVPLPDAAINLGFEEGGFSDRYERTAAGFLDREPVPPGTGIDQLVFGFDLMRDGSLAYRQPMEHPVRAITILVPEDGPRLTGLTDEGVRDLGGLRMRSYAAPALAPGDSLTFRVAGTGGLGGPLLTASAGATALVLALYLAYRLRSTRPKLTQPAAGFVDADSLLRTIAELDAEHEAGRIDAQQWERQRNLLKRQALEIMRDQDA